MQRSQPEAVRAKLAELREHPSAGPPTQLAIERFQALFGERAGAGIAMASGRRPAL